jgi:CDP-diacylglycerol--serine O-phosphatidyltransferase
MLPNGLTLASLFFGVFAIVEASRGEYNRAVGYILTSGMCDAMDGRVARATGTESRFGQELDSLVDAIAFGLAPAVLMYFAVLNKEGWDWVFVFLFVACAVMRLARFNVEQAGRKKTHFRGLPSPAAGGVLATYFWFSETPLYTQTVIGNWPWQKFVRVIMAALAFLMITNVPYPAWPTFSIKTLRGAIGLVLFIGLAVGLVFLPKEFFFPVGLLYVVSPFVAAVVRGLLDKPDVFDVNQDAAHAATGYEELDEDDEEEDEEEARPRPRRRRRRGHRGGARHAERNTPEEPPA